jgi:hypothetical protein
VQRRFAFSNAFFLIVRQHHSDELAYIFPDAGGFLAARFAVSYRQPTVTFDSIQVGWPPPMLHARYKENLEGSMRDAFESWMGQEVVVQLGFGLIKVRLRGVLLQDLRETLLLKPEAGPSIEIPKIRVLAIEEVGRSPNGLLRYVLPANPTENSLNRGF